MAQCWEWFYNQICMQQENHEQLATCAMNKEKGERPVSHVIVIFIFKASYSFYYSNWYWGKSGLSIHVEMEKKYGLTTDR